MKSDFKVYLAMFLLICLAVSFPMYEAFSEGGSTPKQYKKPVSGPSPPY